MGYPTDRVILYDPNGLPLGDLGRDEILSRIRKEELNGEHSLTIVTTRIINSGSRVLTCDGSGKWREYVVTEPDEEHSSGKAAIGTYRCTWSMQSDLTATAGGVLWASATDGTNEPISAQQALSIALTNSPMWRPGTCDVATTAAASLYDASVWEYLSILSENWKGEFDARIEVDSTGVVSRYVDWHAHLGNTESVRRFDWGRDLVSIRRTPDPGPYYCRVVPRGGSDGTDTDGVKYSDRCGIENWSRSDIHYRVTHAPETSGTYNSLDEAIAAGYIFESTYDTVTKPSLSSLVVGSVVADPTGVGWIMDPESALLFRVRMPDGSWFYPTKVVNYSLDTKDDEEELYLKALDDLHSHTRPNVNYEADVMQFAAAGMDAHGVSLGDSTQCADNGFGINLPHLEGIFLGEAGIHIEGRVVGMEVNEFDERETSLEIGNLQKTLADEFKSLSASVSNVSQRVTTVESGGTYNYVRNLVGRLNDVINATDGWTYIVPEHGLVTYDCEVSDPLVGIEATSVTQIKGGSIRIANTRKTPFAGLNDWNWRTVIVSGHIAADMVTAVQVTAGFIGDAVNGNYWDLDNGVLHMDGQVMIGSKSLSETIGDAASEAGASAASEVVGMANGREQVIYRSATSASAGMQPNTTWVTDRNGGQGTWTAKRPRYSNEYPVLWVATQRQTVQQMSGTTCSCTDPMVDETTTIIDGGHITTGTIDASSVDVVNIDAANITTGTIDARQIDVVNIDAGNINTGTLSADRIGAGIISSGKLAQSVNNDIANGVAAYNRGTTYNGTCATAAATAAKVVTCVGFRLVTGATVVVYNTSNQTSAGALTLNVNSTGAKAINVAGAATSSTNRLLWASGSTIRYVYNGTAWVVADMPATVSAKCVSSASANEKVVSSSGIVIFKGTCVNATMSNANTSTGPTLNVSSLGAAAIYWEDTTYRPVNDRSWIAGMRVPLTYDGSVWRMGYQTVIDGGSVATGTLDASKVNVVNLNATNITTGIISDSRGSNRWNLATGEFTLADSSLKVGGKQYLDGTEKFEGWRRAGGWYFLTSENPPYAACNSKNSVSNWNDLMRSPMNTLKYTELRGYEVTVSFEGLSLSTWGAKGATNQIYVRLALTDSNGTVRAYKDNTMVLNTVWTRYKFTLSLTDAMWTRSGIDSSASLTGYYLEVQVYNRSKHAVHMRRFKLERGTVATDWCISENDLFAQAQGAAKAEVKKIDTNLNQDKVFNALTNNGRVKCITRKNGELYINATYINSGTISGDRIKAGVITDKAGNNTWDLKTGKLKTIGMEAQGAQITGSITSVGSSSDYRIMKGSRQVTTSCSGGSGRSVSVKNGAIIGCAGIRDAQGRMIQTTTQELGSIDFASLKTFQKIRLSNPDPGYGTIHKGTYKFAGTRIFSSDFIQLTAPMIYVAASESKGATGSRAITGTVSIEKILYKDSNNKQKSGNVRLQFVNGMLVGVTGTKGLFTLDEKKPVIRGIEILR